MSVLVGILAGAAVLLSRPVRPVPRLDAGAGRAGRPSRQAGEGPQAGSARASPVAAGLGVAVAVALVAPGWLAVGSLPAGLVVWDRVRRLEPADRVRAREQVARELPHVVGLVGSLIRAGAAPDHALGAVARVMSDATRGELGGCLGRLALGADPEEVWRDLARHPQLGRLGSTLHRAAVSGASVEAALDRLADELRSNRAHEVAVRARRVEVQATAPLGGCLLPAFVVVGIVPLVAGVASSLVPG